MRDSLTTAFAAAREAGAILEEYLHRPLTIEEKGRRADLVTQADRASERAIVERLHADFPNATILGEEGGIRKGTSQERWIVDPLDGTTNFAHGYPMFCISIGYERDGELLAGVIYAPMMNELFAAERGSGAQCNDREIHVSKVESVGSAMLCTGFKPFDYDRNARHFAHASRNAQAVRRDGAAALDLAYTAMGRFDAFWEFDLAPWDKAAGALIVRESGGRVSALDGSPFRLDGDSILASNGAVHDGVVSLFAAL
jgi:myo-inositol-1(or 4)-monophosphatase